MKRYYIPKRHPRQAVPWAVCDRTRKAHDGHYVVAFCVTQDIARRVARLLNEEAEK